MMHSGISSIMEKETYLDKLRESARRTRSISCMGLDPVIEAMPEKYSRKGILGAVDYFADLFSGMQNYGILPGAFKPNVGFYLKHDEPLEENFDGSIALSRTIRLIREEFPGIPVILDFKRGDIAKSSANYATEGLERWGADAVTISPYMGTDSVMPFIERAVQQGKGVYILNRTSNPGARDFQNLEVKLFGSEEYVIPLYEAVAYKIVEWAQDREGVGAVVGATSLEELSRIANIYTEKDIAWLIPGVGGQGGKADEVVKRLIESGIDLDLARINSSSGLTHPWVKKKEPVPGIYEAREKCIEALDKLNEDIGYKPTNFYS